MTMLKSFSFVALLVAGFLAIAPQQVDAGTTFNLDTGNSAISGYTGPYATVTVSDIDSTHAEIVVQGLPGTGMNFLVGDGGTIGLNLGNVADASLTQLDSATISYLDSNFHGGNVTLGGAGNEDGFGSFNFSLNNKGGYTQAIWTLDFVISNTGASWSGDDSVLTPNSNNALAAAHIFVAPTTNEAAGALTTGYAAGNNGGGPIPNVGSVPEPTSLVVWGLLSLVGFGYSRRRKVA